MADLKVFFGLLSGLCRKEYYDDATITDEFLRSELFADAKPEVYKKQKAMAQGLISAALDAELSLNDVPAFADQHQLSEDQAKAFAKFWKSNQSKLRDVLIQRTAWRPKLKKSSWRVDSTIKTSRVDETNVQHLLLELAVVEQGKESLRLMSLDAAGVDRLLEDMERVDALLGGTVGTSS
ncbi:uncharacterized protein MONBRDRAFT_38905 [Monosiga brevicollis MX1]|uniref:COMM domain-containing protein 1 n=1 Tax=Monosiga brevicollis TaxID=81824 RepID=A9VAW8_MONBE|nr:uncharacterized protein MONBRDRAFT_38905 [Monosiga brevicollis MX1]EDQ85237.1 predicted protein [Monosiga brevicollis MX1]|eukprot:XP_001749858.1 hypothetical protein [Monosiga brevicollis MX1]